LPLTIQTTTPQLTNCHQPWLRFKPDTTHGALQVLTT